MNIGRVLAGDDHAHRRGIKAVAGVVDLRAVRDDDYDVHLGLEIDRQARSGNAVDDAERIDCAGRVVLPGLIDAHVHVTAVSHDLAGLALHPPSLLSAESAQVMRGMLHCGFTSVRDAAGADFGLQEAQARGLYEGPRLAIAGRPISQTGGHADMRPKGVQASMFCSCAGLGLMGAIADGVGEVRRAVREQVRNGANHIKIMAGGGVSSPTDPIDGTQFSPEELRAAVEEAEAANLYALAHAYSPRAVTRAVQAGVRSIEHGNLVDEATLREMKRHGAWLVPTLSTYVALAEEGERLGWSRAMLDKLEVVRSQGLRALAMARAEDRGQALRREHVDLAALTQEVVRELVPKALERRIDLGYEGAQPGETPRVLAQPVLLGELVRNLLDNALQYTPAGGSATARVLADPFGQVVVLQVEDSGPGVPPAERELIFQPFYRALGTGVDGTGLGLAIVQEIAQQHGAQVTVDDAHPRPLPPGARPGALFTVRFAAAGAGAGPALRTG